MQLLVTLKARRKGTISRLITRFISNPNENRIKDAKMKIGSIVVKCRDFKKMMAFWQEALHYVSTQPAKNGWVILRDPEGISPNISLDLAGDKERLATSKNPRLHLDLYAENQEDEVNRLLKIGAIRHPQTYDPEDDFIVLEDPDGNLFCVVQI
jgi:catechol 2,3-dioxygenase-like lactoylglutathione lyase family enzyme